MSQSQTFTYLGTYRGRFAPSPTGPLHFGSLLAATASYLDAKANDGKWLLRIDDIDPPREKPGAAEHIIRTLEAFGFEWDEPVYFQSRHYHRYDEVLENLRTQQQTFACRCKRKHLLTVAKRTDAGLLYPGYCRELNLPFPANTTRLRIKGEINVFQDLIQGEQSLDLEGEIGDFMIRRSDGLYGYHLACVVDDWDEAITHVVRGADLLPCSHQQMFLQRTLNAPSPIYAHIPIATNQHAQKLSKMTYAPSLEIDHVKKHIVEALKFLNQPSATALTYDMLNQLTIADLWQLAVKSWNLEDIPKVQAKAAPPQYGATN